MGNRFCYLGLLDDYKDSLHLHLTSAAPGRPVFPAMMKPAYMLLD
jgi:hypothetical protein